MASLAKHSVLVQLAVFHNHFNVIALAQQARNV
jgi:hypothetical protein